jgi:hypothetical protein
VGDNSLSNFARVDVIFSSRPRLSVLLFHPLIGLPPCLF